MWNYAFISFLIFTISLIYHYYLKKPVSVIDYPNTHYDYIIVGGGTAGCVLAARLSEASNITVLLVEAGDNFGWLSTVPILAPLLQGSAADWSYKSEPQQFSSKGFWSHKQKFPRGKGLGGSGQMNYLIHSFGRPEDYNNWPKGWSHADILPYFKKVSEIMNVVTVPDEEYLAEAFIVAGESFRDDNATFQKGSYTAKKGSRWTSYHAYLMNAWERENLHILSNTLVSKIFFKESKAVGVKVIYKDDTIGRINARKEVILSGGAINTPQLLLLSGVGPADDLNKFRIPVVRNLSGVGKNLFDQLCMPLYVNLQARVSITLVKLQTLYEVLNYFVLGKGWYATNGIMGTGRVNDSGLILFGVATAEEKIFREIGNYQPHIFRSLFPSFNDTRREGFIYLASCLLPKSRGEITLKSTNIRDAPKINPAYLERMEDIHCTHSAINVAIDTLNTSLLRKYGAAIHVPDLEECRYLPQDYRDERFSECVLRIAGLTSYHPGGTCKMGTDSNAVIDENLRVRGLEGIRIVDASILPSPISGTPNSVLIAMSEYAADIILTETPS